MHNQEVQAQNIPVSAELPIWCGLPVGMWFSPVEINIFVNILELAKVISCSFIIAGCFNNKSLQACIFDDWCNNCTSWLYSLNLVYTAMLGPAPIVHVEPSLRKPLFFLFGCTPEGANISWYRKSTSIRHFETVQSVTFKPDLSELWWKYKILLDVGNQQHAV